MSPDGWSVRKTLAFLTLALIIAFAICIRLDGALAIDEVVDDYTDTASVNVTIDVVHNSTLDVMELNYTSGENFNAWTEVDIGGDHIAITTPKVAWNSQPRAGDTRAYRDYGSGFFGDFSIDFEMEYTDVEAGDASNAMINTPFAISNSNGDWDAIWASRTLLIYASQDAATDDRMSFIIYTRAGGVTIGSSAGIQRNLAKYYMRVSRTGGTFKAQFYSDEARMALVFQLSCNAPLDTLRYCQIAVSRNHPSDGADHSTGYIQYLGGAGYALTGYFTTTNLMTGLGENVTVVLTNTSIPGGTINLEWSPDGAAWTDLGGVPTNTWAFDLRGAASQDAIFRFNFTRGAPNITPRLYQVRLVHEGGAAPMRGAVDVSIYYGLAIILLLIGLMIGLGDRRRP